MEQVIIHDALTASDYHCKSSLAKCLFHHKHVYPCSLFWEEKIGIDQLVYLKHSKRASVLLVPQTMRFLLGLKRSQMIYIFPYRCRTCSLPPMVILQSRRYASFTYLCTNDVFPTVGSPMMMTLNKISVIVRNLTQLTRFPDESAKNTHCVEKQPLLSVKTEHQN